MTETGYFFKRISTGVNIPLAPLMSIGRSEDSALRLVEGVPSRHHAQLSSDADGVFIEDLGSTNGTFVNGQRLDASVRRKLAAGDRVRFDIEEFEFIAPAAQPSSDADKTVFRPPDADKTVFRAPQAPKTVVEPRRTPAEEPAAQKAAPSRAPETGKHAAARPPDVEKSNASAMGHLPRSFPEPSGKETVFMKPRKSANNDTTAPSMLAAVDAPCLWVASGERAGEKIELRTGVSSKAVWSIGSGEDRDIRLSDPGVSAVHATLRSENRTWQLTDEASANGTFVNDIRMLNSYLSDRDRVRLGPVECVFRAPPAGGARGSGSRWRKIAIIVAVACVVTLAVLFALMKLL
jgi:pSer/pThr/pTyr-binding forkhead associated (FHA) protein